MLGEVYQQICSQANAQRQWALAACLVLIVAWRAFHTLSIYHNRPRNVRISGPSLRWGKWLSSVQYVLNAPNLIDRAYKEAKGKPFALPALDEYQVFVSSEEHIREVNESSQDHLSLHEAMEDRVKHKYTMNGFEQSGIDPHDTVPGRVLKFLLRTSMPELRTRIKRRIEQAYDQVLSKGKPSKNDWTEISVFSLAETISLRMNCQVIAGDQLADNEDYVSAVLQYSRDSILSMEFCRYMPSFLVSYICPGIMAWSGAMIKIARYLTPLVERRLEELRQDEKTPPLDCITWVIESSATPKQRSIQRIVQQLIALIFASAHQIPMVLVFAIYNMCLHPEYIEPLREEARSMLELPPESQYKNMPLLESFLRESARVNPLDSLSVQRKVMRPFTFSDGSHVPAGNVVCVPQQALMRDARYYPDPDKFDGFRFVVPEARSHEQPVLKYTDVTPSFPFWGASKKACPGRWYVSAALKQILSHLLTNFEFRLSDPHAPLTFAYTTMVIPRHSTKILLRKR